MPRPGWTMVLASIALVTSPAAAQQPEADSSDVLVLAHSFVAGTREFVRVFLQKGQVYRAEVNLGNVGFSIRPVNLGGEPPTVALIRGGTAASRESVYEIYPFKDDEYQIQVLDVPEGESGNLRLFRDIRASRRRQDIATSPGGGTSLGIEVVAGRHSNYQLNSTETSRGTDRAGGDLEACVSLRASGFAWGCLLGISRHSSDKATDVLWFFVEPRFRLTGGRPESKLELGVLLRGSFGSAEEIGNDPSNIAQGSNPGYLAPGVYLRYWFGRNPGIGATIGISGYHAFIAGADTDNESFHHIGAGFAFHF